jgi:hypothetical protein
MNPEVADMQYVYPSPSAGMVGQLSSDGGFGGFGNDDLPGTRYGGLKLWETKYQFQEDMLPMFVGEAFGKKASRWTTSTIMLFHALCLSDLLHRQKPKLHSIWLSR